MMDDEYEQLKKNDRRFIGGSMICLIAFLVAVAFGASLWSNHNLKTPSKRKELDKPHYSFSTPEEMREILGRYRDTMLGDIDSDGDTDIVVRDRGRVRMYENKIPKDLNRDLYWR